MSWDAEGQVRAILERKRKTLTPLTALLGDDDFCAQLMRHRAGQGLSLPHQEPTIPVSARLAFLRALSSGEGISDARDLCDDRKALREHVKAAMASHGKSLTQSVADFVETLLSQESSKSHFAAQYLLFGGDRIPQAAIPLHERETDIEQSVSIVGQLVRRPPDATITLSDTDTKTGHTSFIRMGREPSHFDFPEMRDPKSVAAAAILHYEIDHPGGDFAFFTSAGCELLSERMMDIQDACPLYINDMPQLMALNSYQLQEMGAFCVPIGDTQITLRLQDGVVTACERPDYGPQAESILADLAERGVSQPDLSRLRHFLRTGDVPDSDWDLIEAMTKEHPDLLGNAEMEIDRSQMFGMPAADMRALVLSLCAGDEQCADEDMRSALDGAAVIALPAGRLHLYVPNLAAEGGTDQALDMFNEASGRKDADLMCVLSDHELEFSDPARIATMRRVTSPVMEAPEFFNNIG